MEREYSNLSRAAAIREYKDILKLVHGGTNNDSMFKMLIYAIKLKDYFNL